jgi:DNA-binding transcriptional LysR family regulator
MDPRQLVTFEAVARTGSFSAAARELHLTQPSVSRQVAALERNLGGALLERLPGRLRLTDLGELLLEQAESISGQLSSLRALAAQWRAAERGALRIVGFPTAMSSFVPAACSALLALHPDLDVHLAERSPRTGAAEVRRFDADIALVFRGPDAAGERFPGTERLLVRERFVVALPAGHRLADRRAIELAELAGELWARGTQGDPRTALIQRACVAAGFEPRVVAELDNQLGTRAFVAAGLGVTLLPELGLRWMSGDVVTRPLRDPGPERDVLAVALDSAARRPAVAAMLDALEVAAVDTISTLRRGVE